MTLIVIHGIEKRAHVFRCVCMCVCGVSVKTVWVYFHRMFAIRYMLVNLFFYQQTQVVKGLTMDSCFKISIVCYCTCKDISGVFFFPMVQQPSTGPRPPHFHTDTPHSVGFLDK
jgi:hypothetical protein